MKYETKKFLIDLCKLVLDDTLEHDCRRTDVDDACTFCYKACIAIEELYQVNNYEKLTK